MRSRVQHVPAHRHPLPPGPLSPYVHFHFSARSYRTHYNPNRTRVNVTSWPPPPAGELLSVFSSLCADPFDAAEVRSSLWHLFYVSERFELEQLRQFKQVCPLPVTALLCLFESLRHSRHL
jgi:hypothetical protein